MDGLLLIDKPSGWSSFDIVAKVRGQIKAATGEKLKVGHTGTLDPLATGLMIIVIGNYCKRAAEFSKLDKTYSVVMRLGQTSTTADEEGKKTDISNIQPSLETIEQALTDFIGETMQTPPAFSAIKIAGKRAYKLARSGQEVIIEPRKVRISSINLTKYEYPFVEFDANVGSGTYIRSLVEDIGKKLGTGAYMSNLRRTSIGRYTIENAVAVTQINLQESIISG